jgi:hypothetical protein
VNVEPLSNLPAHSKLVDRLRQAVASNEKWRWLELSCSLAAERGDELSDVDVGIGHITTADQLVADGTALLEAVGKPLDVLAHSERSWPDGILRFAVEYDNGLQLDLVLMPASQRPGLPDGSVALVDKDGHLDQPWTPPVADATASDAREWTMLGWWALSNVAKYVARNSLFEAVQALHEARTQAVRLFAAGRGIPYPEFGLTSLLDFEPVQLPARLEETYATPSSAQRVLDAGWALVGLLAESSRSAGNRFDTSLDTPWAEIATTRLRTVDPRA